MKLNKLLLKQGIIYDDQSIVVGISNNDKTILPGEIYFAMKGNLYNGNDYIENAFKQGAILVISEELSGDKIINVKDIKSFLEEMIKNFYGDFYNNFFFVGVTGTNGKTTTTSLIHQCLKVFNHRSILIGTNGIYYDEITKPSNNTTPDFLDLIKNLNEAYHKGIRTAVMEVSSHALTLNRLKDIKFDIVIFTNLSPEHQDFHHTMEDYLGAKMMLFTKVKEDGIGIINGDDKYAPFFAFINKYYLVGQNIGNQHLVILQEDNVIIKLNDDIVYSKLNGNFNAYNLAFCYLALKEMGYTTYEINHALQNILPVEGRMELIKYRNNDIIIDFGHTPDAIKNVLQYLKKKNYHRLYALFGCGGNRDAIKRPIMLEITQQYADEVIISDDNPRFEDSIMIINDILKGIKKDFVHIISNRALAIEFAIKQLTCHDCLVIFGKGHEKYQIIRDNKLHFSDYEEVIKWIKE